MGHRYLKDYKVSELNPYEFYLSSPERNSVSMCKVLPFRETISTSLVPSTQSLPGNRRRFTFESDAILSGIIRTVSREVFGKPVLKLTLHRKGSPKADDLLYWTRKISFSRSIDPVTVISGLIEFNVPAILMMFSTKNISVSIRMVDEFFRCLKKSIDEMQQEFIVIKYR